MSVGFQWTDTLEAFIRQRLTDRVAATPSGLANTQYLIEGIVLAISDNPTAYSASFLAIENVIASCSKLLSSNNVLNAESAAQSLFTSWCLLDAVSKACPIAELHQMISARLPALVAEHMPLYLPVGAGTAGLHVAWQSYSPLYWSMIRSWAAEGVFSHTVMLQCGEALEVRLEALHQEAAREHAREGNANEQSSEAIQEAVVSKLLTTSAQGAVVDRALGAGAITGMLNSFYAIGGHRDSHICLDCGISFPSSDAQREHKEYHRYLQTDPTRPARHLQRLLAPSADTFSCFGGSASGGAFPRAAEPQTEVERRGGSGVDNARVRALQR